MARWKIMEVIRQGVVTDPDDHSRDGTTTLLRVSFAGRGEQTVEFAPTVDREGIARTLTSMSERYEEYFEQQVIHGPLADDLRGLTG